jgi:hypothetical protein
MCPRDAVAQWRTGDMRLEDFRKLVSYLKEVETAVLEGCFD